MKRTTTILFFYFYRQITTFNFLLSFGAGLFAPIGYSGIKGFLTTFMLSFMIVGFAGALYFFELRKKKQFYLFYNIGLCRIKLYAGSFLLNLLLFIPLQIIWHTL